MQVAKALASLCICAGLPKPLLLVPKSLMLAHFDHFDFEWVKHIPVHKQSGDQSYEELGRGNNS